MFSASLVNSVEKCKSSDKMCANITKIKISKFFHFWQDFPKVEKFSKNRKFCHFWRISCQRQGWIFCLSPGDQVPGILGRFCPNPGTNSTKRVIFLLFSLFFMIFRHISGPYLQQVPGTNDLKKAEYPPLPEDC